MCAKIFEVGMEFTNNEGHTASIVGFTKGSHTRSRVAHLKFEDGTIINVKTPKIRTGSFKNPNYPSVHGVGYIGQGNYKSSVKGLPSRAYRKWEAMISRCYNTNDVRYTSYGEVGVYVEESWKNFQNFAEWYYLQDSPKDRDFELDKDIKGTFGGVNYYSESTCFLIPKTANILFSSIYSSNNTRTRVEGVYEGYRYNKEGKAEIVISSKRICIIEDYLLSEKIMKLYKIRRIFERNTTCETLIKDIDRHLKYHYNIQQEVRNKL